MIRDARLLKTYLLDLLDSLPDASFMVNSTGGIVLVNALAEKMFGYPRQELRGKSIDTLIPERFRRVHAGHCLDYFARPRARAMGVGLSLRALRQDGVEFPVEISLSQIETDEDTFVLGVIRDISQSEERYRAIFEQVAVGVVHSNSEGRLLNVNPKFCEISGYTREEALALDIHRLTHQDDIAKSIEARARMLDGTSSDYEREVRLIRKGGIPMWTHITTSLVRGADGRPVHFISVIHDISAQKRAEEERHETEVRFRQVTENIREVFWLTDPSKNEMLYVSPAYEVIWGRDVHTLYASPRDWVDAIHPEDRDRVFEAAQTTQVAGGYDKEYRIVRPDGGVRWIRDRAFPVRDENRKVIRVAGVAEDITERKRSESSIARLVELRTALSEVNRTIVHAATEDALFAQICEIAVRRAGFALAWIGVPHSDSGTVRPIAAAGTPAGLEYGKEIELSYRDVPAGRGAVGTAIRESRTVIANDLLADARYAPWHGAARRAGINASATLPLQRGGEVVAVLLVSSETVGYFDAETVALLEEVAQDVSFSLGVMAHDREHRLAQQELEFKNVILSTQQNTSLDGILVVDEDRRIISYNRRFVELWGIPQDILQTRSDERALQSVLDVLEDPQEFLRQVNELYEHKEERSSEELRLKDGRVFDCYSAPMIGADGRYHGRVWYFRDITERKRSEELLRESEARFRAVIEQSIAAVYVIQNNRIAYVNPRMREIFGYGLDEDFDPNPLAHIQEADRARVVEQMQRRLQDEPEATYSVGAVRKDGTPFILGVHAKRASYGGKPAIITIAQDITEKARAEAEIKHYIMRIEQAMQSTINVVATIGELRDPYTHGHERRVGEIAAAIATEMGLDGSRVEGMRIAGYLHDVGKIGVPAEILAKPSRLTKAEFELVKDHAQQSYEILKRVEFPWPVALAAWQHHERLDGSGYPRGLKGEQIILEARILAVADTLEAMSSHRPYRPGLGLAAALAELEKGRGRIYDPEVVDACLRLFREKAFQLPV